MFLVTWRSVAMLVCPVLKCYFIKISESIKGTKEVQKNSTFAFGSVEIKNGIKEKVLDCQRVTTS
jgi:hypothetical protein